MAATSATVHMATTTLKVEGMTCGACTSAVESGLSKLDGVGHVSVSLTMERAVVQHDPVKAPADLLKETVDDCGFDGTILSTDTPIGSVPSELADIGSAEAILNPLATTTLSVGGMTCGACTSAVEGAFKDTAGVKSVSVSLLSERAVIEHDDKVISSERLAEVIEDTGFDATVLDSKISTKAPAAAAVQAWDNKTVRATTTTVAIEGMTCGACTSAVEGAFQGVEGLFQFNISLLAERAVLVHAAEKLSAAKIVEAIEDRGFDAHIISSMSMEIDAQATSVSVSLKIYGLRDASEASDLEDSLRTKPGIKSIRVDPRTFRASITHDSSIIGVRGVVEAVEEAGYNALVAESDDNNAQLESLAKTKEIQEWRRMFKISISFAIPVFLTSMIFPMFFPVLNYGAIKLPVIPGLWLGDVVCLCLTIPVQFGIGKRFYVSAWKSLKHKSPTMDVLVVLGTSAAFFFSVAAMIVSILTPPHTRPATVFDTSTMLITFITLGRLLENGAKSQTSKALSRLMSLAPSMATIYADPIVAQKLSEQLDEKEKTEPLSSSSEASLERVVPTELLEVGDVVVLRPGDKIPADGTVIRGESYVDESMVTGEAMPILKKPRSLLMAGTVNGAGRLDFKVTRAGRDTQLSQIVRLVQEAQMSRAPIQRMADIVAGYFVPIIIGLGVTTFIGWMVLSHILRDPPKVFVDPSSGGRFMVCLKLCISVIVFACPCALGLSTPTAVMVGTGIGAENGILVKGGAALETATKITHVVFDKTGTLTSGKMSVSQTDIETPQSEERESWNNLWWTLVGLTEMSSEHPIGKAIVRAAKDHLQIGTDSGIDGVVEDFQALVGKGVSANVRPALTSATKPYPMLIGNASFMLSHKVKLPTPSTTSKTPPGSTVIHIAISGSYSGTLYLSDTIKPSAAATVTALSLYNITCSIVTGDAAPAALAVAKAVNITEENVHFSCTPSQKQDMIRKLQEAGHVVAMVGDGINDSPALATADVGISLSSGTDVAMEAADVVLMRSGPEDLLDVAASLHLARTIFRRIKLNLGWACGYNAIGLPFAMGVFLPWGLALPPMAAGAAMACSSVSVVVSSLLLRFWQRPRWMDIEYLEREAKKPKSGIALMIERFMTKVDKLMSRRRRESVVYVPLETIEEEEEEEEV